MSRKNKNQKPMVVRSTKRNIIALGARMRPAPAFADRRRVSQWQDEDWGEDAEQ